MSELGRYCTETQMFVEEPHKLNVDKLLMWRQIAENSCRLGRYPEGPPAGDIALAMVVATDTPIDKIMDRKIRRGVKNEGRMD